METRGTALPLSWPRYAWALILAAVAGAVFLLLGLLPAGWGDPVVRAIVGLVTAFGVGALMVLLMTDPALAGSPFLNPAAALTAAGLVGLGLTSTALGFGFMWSGLFFTLGLAGWLWRLGRPPFAGHRVLKLGLILLLAAPLVALAIPVLVMIATEGDNSWMAAYLAVPGVVAAPFAVLSAFRILRARGAS